MKFEREYPVGIRDIGRNNQMTNYAIISFLEEVACTHSATVGFGVNDIETKQKVWILMDWKVKVLDRPKYGDILKLKTWARPIEKHIFFTYRDFQVFNGEKLCAIATTKWVLIDKEKNKIAKIENDIINLYLPEDEKVFEEADILKIKEPEKKELSINYEVKRADIDINKHMHNSNYLKLAYEVLPEENYFDEEKNNVRIMYKHQIVLGDKVKCYYIHQENKDIITIKSEDESILNAVIELY